MANVNSSLAKRRKIVIGVIITLILVVVFVYSYVVYMNAKKSKTYTTMEREMYMAAKKYVSEVQPFDNGATVSLDIDASKLLDTKYLGSMRDPEDKNNVCTGSVNVTKTSGSEYEYIVLLNCGQYKNNGVKYNEDGKVLESKVYTDNSSDDNNSSNTNDDNNTTVPDNSSNNNGGTDNNQNNNVVTPSTDNSSNTGSGNSSSNNNNNNTNTGGSNTGGTNVGDNSNIIGTIDSSTNVVEQPITSGTMVNGRMIKIVDRSSGNCAQAIEYYYSDSKYKYYFNCILSPSIFVIIDGVEYNLKVALNSGVVSMAELEKAGFRPMKKPNNLVDR